MAPKSNVPVRICGSKTRSGCRTCKQRHVKCDETRPVCNRCQKADRQCIYERPRSPGSEGGSDLEKAQRLQSRLEIVASNPNTGLSSYGPREVAEVDAVKNFAIHLGNDLAGCFSNDIWCYILPRVAQHEPSVWHGVVAVSLLDTSLRLGHDPDDASPEINTAIVQYSKAMQELNSRLESGMNTCCKDVVLLSCILFTVFECLQSHYNSALRHISGGMKLLMEWGDDTQHSTGGCSGSYLSYSRLQPIFLALDSQAIQMGIGSRIYQPLPAMGDQLQTPKSFATLDEAHLRLTHIFNRLSHWSAWIEPSTAAGNSPGELWIELEAQILRMELASWDSAFKPLWMTLSHQPAALLLRVHRKILQIYFNKYEDGPSEMAWDKQLSRFQEAVEYAEAYMELAADTTETAPRSWCRPDRPRAVLTVSMDIVLSLFLISVKCRDSATRRRGLRMLKICGRKEGIWDSFRCYQLAKTIIEREEAGADEDGLVPESVRIFELDVRVSEDRVEKVLHKKHVVDEDGGQHTQMVDETPPKASTWR